MAEGTGGNGISRRTALKGIGIGAAVAWTAPVVLSFESPAFAGSMVCTNCDTTCPRSGNQCAPGYFCLTRISGGCVCVFANFCSQATNSAGSQTCTTDADCASFPGTVCAITCCGGGANICVNPADPPGGPTAGWDVAGFYRCTSNTDCNGVSSPYGAKNAYTHCAPMDGISVCLDAGNNP